jgi:hypothetical protein
MGKAAAASVVVLGGGLSHPVSARPLAARAPLAVTKFHNDGRGGADGLPDAGC